MQTKHMEKIKMWRRREISIYRIAKELDVCWVTVYRWLKGTSKPSYKHKKLILEKEIEL